MRPLEALAAITLAVLAFGLGHVTAQAAGDPPTSSVELLEPPSRSASPPMSSEGADDATEAETIRLAELARRSAEARWYAGVARAELEGRWYAAAAEADAARAARAAGRGGTLPDASASAPPGLEPCGGDLPPCWVKARESGGDYRAVNPTGCGGRTCGGAWQFDPRTWNGYGGYTFAQDAPPEVQDAKAREVWAGGAGCRHWGRAACG